MKNKKIIITGSTGFIGSRLTEYLNEQGCELHLLLRDVNKGKNLFPFAEVYDAACDVSELKTICNAIKPDGVIHLATHFSANHKTEEFEDMLEANIILGAKLLEAVSPVAKWFLNIGTYWQHYEGQRYSPVNFYAATKQAFEDLLVFFADHFKINVGTLCLNDTYGPGDTRRKIFNLWRDMCLNPDQTLEMSPGEQIMDMLHIKDVVSAIEHCAILLENDTDGVLNKQIFYVTAAEKPTLKELSRIFEKISGSHLNIIWGAKPYRHREVMNPLCYGKKLPGWEAEIKYEEGISDFLNSMEF